MNYHRVTLHFEGHKNTKTWCTKNIFALPLVHADFIVFEFYFKYRFVINILYHYCIERGFSYKTFAKKCIIVNCNK